MDLFLEQIKNGIALGSIYALIALGYTMVYGIVKLINFAHGDILMVGAYTGFFVLMSNGISLPSILLAFVVSMIVCALFGVVIERTCYKPLRESPRINSLITAIGVSIILENGARAIPFIGPNYRQFPTFNDNAFLTVILVSTALTAMLFFFVEFTKSGKAMRAVSQDNKAALLMGIDVDRVIALTFAIGAVLAAAAGILSANAYPQLQPYMGIMPGLKAFVAAVLGGIGSIPGAVVGGLIIGLAETLTKGYGPTQLADGVSFAILIIILVFRPTGLLGRKINEKV